MLAPHPHDAFVSYYMHMRLNFFFAAPARYRKEAEMKLLATRSHQMCSEGLASTVPKSIYKYFVVLDGDWADSAAQIKGTPFEHHTVLVVDTGAFWENQERGGVSSRDMGLHPFAHNLTVFDLQQHQN